MSKITQVIKKFIRKGFWLFPKQVKLIEDEADKNFGGNQSALMRHIINNWFEK